MEQGSENRGQQVPVSRVLRAGGSWVEPLLIFAMLMLLAYAGQT